jgi:hypothetical protein
MNTTDNRDAFYASVRAIEALCPACKQPQNAPSCEQRQHTPIARNQRRCGHRYTTYDCLDCEGPTETIHDPRLCGQSCV